ncbi:ABC-2 type transporter [bacterium BMS3Bbin01]|nr:ABC-2 type transporter [bacterium BMS3Bbin01]
MNAAAAAFRMQLRLAWRTPNYWMVQISTIPTVIIFLSVIEAFDRPDLLINALLAPILMAMWGTALWTGGSVMRDDRWHGRLELHAAAPIGYGLVVTARVAAVVMLSLLIVPLTLATAWATYGIDIRIAHPFVLVVALMLIAAAITGTGMIFSSLTILSRAATTFQSSASYPFLLLGGVFVPLSLLPVWVQPLGRLVFLSWGSDLIRDSVTQPVLTALPWRLGAIAVLGSVGFVAAQWLVRVVLHRVMVTGEIAAP